MITFNPVPDKASERKPPSPQHVQNMEAYRALKQTIALAYPKGRFVAIHGGRIVADGATLDELLAALRALGLDPQQSLAVQAGDDSPEYAAILLKVVRA